MEELGSENDDWKKKEVEAEGARPYTFDVFNCFNGTTIEK
jgi:hypothetical protein